MKRQGGGKHEGLLDVIADSYQRFSKGQKRIAEYIMNSYDDAAFMTAAAVGETVGVSESDRLCALPYAIGLDGYPALQEALQELIRHRLTSVQRIRLAASMPQNDILRRVLTDDMNNIRATIDMIDNEGFHAAINALLARGASMCWASAGAMSLAQFLTYYLDYVCDNVMFVNGAVQDIYERMIRLGRRTSARHQLPRYSARTVDAMRYAKQRGATVVTLTDVPNSPRPVRRLCALRAQQHGQLCRSLVRASRSSTRSSRPWALRARTRAFRHLGQLEQIWSEEGVYMTEPRAAAGREDAAHGRP